MKSYHDLERAAFVLDESAFRQNLSFIKEVEVEAGVTIILALKAFSFWPAFSIVKDYLTSATASSLNEALLVQKHLESAPHVYCPAYLPEEIDQLLKISSKLTFNSISELERYRSKWKDSETAIGFRVNPLYSDVKTELYNPSNYQSRLGVPMNELPALVPDGVSGIHVHSLCESPASATAELLSRLKQGLASQLEQLKWLNLGGGHLMTRKDYDRSLLIKALCAFREDFPHLELILEPGSAHAWEAGDLVAHVLDIVDHNGLKTAILDISFTCHMPDVLEMPYLPTICGAQPREKKHQVSEGYEYALGGLSCLAGDIIQPYIFDEPLEIGKQIVFRDMLHYTTVKTTQFNGVRLPDLAIRNPEGIISIKRRYTYDDYEAYLG